MKRSVFIAFSFLFLISNVSSEVPQKFPTPNEEARQSAERFNKTSNTVMRSVYGPLAEWITREFDLKAKKGIGIDIGGGNGNLVLEFCEETRHLHWFLADINQYFFPFFYKQAMEKGHGHRVSAIFADAVWLPFRDAYADVIVSRGSFQFWGDLQTGLGEVYRVLKPGGVAFIGRGVAPDMPVDDVRAFRKRQNGGPSYDLEKTNKRFISAFKQLDIDSYKILQPNPAGSEGVNYGIWVIIRK
ncbi:methyltransferase domain-containing protein [bacterium]|nr:methyltransferase domain-containing protein [bacterium]